MIRPIRPEDAAAICAIYNPYVAQTVITFEQEPVSVGEMRERVETLTARRPWLVWEEEGQVVGYAYVGDWKARVAYRHTPETSIYLAMDHTGRGIGRRLYEGLLEELRRGPTHSVIGVLALPNPASVALHEGLGFEKVGLVREAGFKFERWIDIGYWQLFL